MTELILTVHLIAMAIALGGRLIFIPILKQTVKAGLNERLDELQSSQPILRYADLGLLLALVSGLVLFFLSGFSLVGAPWSFKLKLVTLVLLIIDIGAFHIALSRINQHYDKQMVPAIERLNTLAVVLLSTMVLFAVL